MLRYWLHSLISIDSSIAQICCACMSFKVVVVVGVVSVVVVVVVVSPLVVFPTLLVQTFDVLEFWFFRQWQAMWPCKQHLKHLPSLANWVHSLGVSFLKFVVVVVASMSIRTMWELELVQCAAHCWFCLDETRLKSCDLCWLCCCAPVSLTLYFYFALVTSVCATTFHLSIMWGILSLSRASLWMPLLRPSQNCTITPSVLRAHPAARASHSKVAM